MSEKKSLFLHQQSSSAAFYNQSDDEDITTWIWSFFRPVLMIYYTSEWWSVINWAQIEKERWVDK